MCLKKKILGIRIYSLHDDHKSFNNIFRLITGMCTVHGGCRVLGNDYIFQGGCGELSRFVVIVNFNVFLATIGAQKITLSVFLSVCL